MLYTIVRTLQNLHSDGVSCNDFYTLISNNPKLLQEIHSSTKSKTSYSVASVRKRTIPTERPPLVGEVSANICKDIFLREKNNPTNINWQLT
jgi:hypothetical protein